MEEWLRWLFGVILAVYLPIIGWIVIELIKLDRRVIVMEKEPKIDPVAHATAMAQLSSSIVLLAKQLEQGAESRREQFQRLEESHRLFTAKLNEIERELKAALRERA